MSYDIVWHNLQEGAQLTSLVLPGALNVGDAYSRGFETEMVAAVTDHLSAQLDYTYDQTKLTSYNSWVYPIVGGAPTFGGVSVQPPPVGSPLPGTPKNSLEIGLTYGHVPLAGGELAYSINAHYQSALIPALSADIPLVHGYTMLDTRLNYTLPHWTISAYCNNLTNNLGISSYSDPFNYANFYQAVVSTPRTVGVSASYRFKEE